MANVPSTHGPIGIVGGWKYSSIPPQASGMVSAWPSEFFMELTIDSGTSLSQDHRYCLESAIVTFGTFSARLI